MDWYIELQGSGYKYQFKLIKNMPERQNKLITSISIPGEAATNNILLTLQGMERTIDLTWTMYDDGTDKSMGTAPSGVFPNGVKTIEQQKKWLRDYVHSKEITASWKLYCDDYPNGIECVISNIFFDPKSDTPLSTDATMKLTVGEAI